LRRAGLVALVLLPLAGCGGSSPAEYAGMSEYEARTDVQQAMLREREDPTSLVYRHRVELVRVDRGHARTGAEAWVGTFADRTGGGRICVRVVGHPHAFGTDVDVELDDCAVGAPGV
jgi:hypothetical protein